MTKQHLGLVPRLVVAHRRRAGEQCADSRHAGGGGAGAGTSMAAFGVGALHGFQ